MGDAAGGTGLGIPPRRTGRTVGLGRRGASSGFQASSPSPALFSLLHPSAAWGHMLAAGLLGTCKGRAFRVQKVTAGAGENFVLRRRSAGVSVVGCRGGEGSPSCEPCRPKEVLRWGYRPVGLSVFGAAVSGMRPAVPIVGSAASSLGRSLSADVQ